MSKILLYTDNHFCQYSSIIRSNGNNYSTRLENQIESLNWVEQLAIDKGCDQVIHLGDFFDKPDLNSQELSALKEIKWNNLKHTFIVGNHELGSNDLKYNSLNALSKVGTIIDKPTITSGYGYEILLLPYILENNRKELKDYIREAREDYWINTVITDELKQFIILSHNDISGIRYGQYESKGGFSLEEISDNCNLFINGHLHNQQQINDKVLNLGNLTGQNFSEDGFKYSHCAAVLDTDTLKVELINNPYAFYFYKIDSFEDILKHKDVFNNNLSIGSIKVNQDAPNDIRSTLETLFKEYRLMIEFSTNKSDNTEQLLSSDHIQQFKDYCRSNISNEYLEEELSLL